MHCDSNGGVIMSSYRPGSIHYDQSHNVTKQRYFEQLFGFPTVLTILFTCAIQQIQYGLLNVDEVGNCMILWVKRTI